MADMNLRHEIIKALRRADLDILVSRDQLDNIAQEVEQVFVRWQRWERATPLPSIGPREREVLRECSTYHKPYTFCVGSMRKLQAHGFVEPYPGYLGNGGVAKAWRITEAGRKLLADS